MPEYKPAPGQFINELPKYEIGDTQSTMNRKALESIGYNTRILISLGGYGGYVICGFDHTIVNVPENMILKFWEMPFMQIPIRIQMLPKKVEVVNQELLW